MIYLFYGNDVAKTRTKAFEWVTKARAKEPNLTYTRLSREDMTAAALEDAALSGGLFTRRLLVLLDDPFPVASKKEDEQDEDADGEESFDSVVETYLDALAASENAILILAPKLAQAKAKKLAAKAKMAYTFDTPDPRREAARGFNSRLVEALAARNGEKLWLEVNRALVAGDAPEMLHGLLHWEARELMLKGSRAWKPEEARALSRALIELLQSSRQGGLGLSLALERFALSI